MMVYDFVTFFDHSENSWLSAILYILGNIFPVLSLSHSYPITKKAVSLARSSIATSATIDKPTRKDCEKNYSPSRIRPTVWTRTIGVCRPARLWPSNRLHRMRVYIHLSVSRFAPCHPTFGSRTNIFFYKLLVRLVAEKC